MMMTTFSSITSSSNNHSDEEQDGLETAILRRGSNPDRNTDREYQKGEELAFCKSLACLLTQSRDLPKLCHTFPTVVQAVDHQHQLVQQQRPLSPRSGGNMVASSSFAYYEGIPPPSDR